MVKSASLVATLVVLASVAGAVPAAALGLGAVDEAHVAGTETGNESMAPGERLSGVVGAEKAAVQGEVEARAFGQRVAAAASNDSKARVVGESVADLQTRLEELQAEKAELQTARENGTLSTGEYRARLAQLHAEQRSLERLANGTEAVARTLPAETLRENGVNVSAIQTLRTEARNLTGPEVAEIARSISGKSAGAGLGPDAAGPPDFVTNRTDGTGPGTGPGAGNGAGPPENASDGPPSDGEQANSSNGQEANSGASENAETGEKSETRENATNGADGTSENATSEGAETSGNDENSTNGTDDSDGTAGTDETPPSEAAPVRDQGER